MHRFAYSFCFVISLFLAACGSESASHRAITSVDMYKGDYATVNSFVFSNGKSMLVLDVQRKPREAKELVDLMKSKNLPLEYILISHGHTDHFTGMAIVADAFPEAEIVVANQNIKDSIKAYAEYMDSGGATEGEPALDPSIKPKSPDFPQGWDYDANIKVLNASEITLSGGGTLELATDYLPTEADYMTTVYSKDLNALFLSDLGYNHVHNWIGDDISWSDVTNWRTELIRLKNEYIERQPIIYPGHGDVTDMNSFDEMIGYIEDYTSVVQSAQTQKEAFDKMVSLYPDYGEADFFLKYSILNHLADKPEN